MATLNVKSTRPDPIQLPRFKAQSLRVHDTAMRRQLRLSQGLVAVLLVATAAALSTLPWRDSVARPAFAPIVAVIDAPAQNAAN